MEIPSTLTDLLPHALGVAAIDTAGNIVVSWAGIVFPFHPAPVVTGDVAVSDTLGGAPLVANWSASLCVCFPSCVYTVRLARSSTLVASASGGRVRLGDESVMWGPNGVSNSTAFTTTAFPAIDGDELRVDVQCGDMFGRISPWTSSDGVRIVTSSRTIAIADRVTHVANVSGSAGTADLYVQSSHPLTVNLTIAPSRLGAVLVSVNRTSRGTVYHCQLLVVAVGGASVIDFGFVTAARSHTPTYLPTYPPTHLTQFSFGCPCLWAAGILNNGVPAKRPVASLSCLSVCNASADNSSVDQTGSGPSAPLVCSLPTSPADQSCTFSSSCLAACNGWNVTTECTATNATAFNDTAACGKAPDLPANASLGSIASAEVLLPSTVAVSRLRLWADSPCCVGHSVPSITVPTPDVTVAWGGPLPLGTTVAVGVDGDVVVAVSSVTGAITVASLTDAKEWPQAPALQPPSSMTAAGGQGGKPTLAKRVSSNGIVAAVAASGSSLLLCPLAGTTPSSCRSLTTAAVLATVQATSTSRAVAPLAAVGVTGLTSFGAAVDVWSGKRVDGSLDIALATNATATITTVSAPQAVGVLLWGHCTSAYSGTCTWSAVAVPLPAPAAACGTQDTLLSVFGMQAVGLGSSTPIATFLPRCATSSLVIVGASVDLGTAITTLTDSGRGCGSGVAGTASIGVHGPPVGVSTADRVVFTTVVACASSNNAGVVTATVATSNVVLAAGAWRIVASAACASPLTAARGESSMLAEVLRFGGEAVFGPVALPWFGVGNDTLVGVVVLDARNGATVSSAGALPRCDVSTTVQLPPLPALGSGRVCIVAADHVIAVTDALVGVTYLTTHCQAAVDALTDGDAGTLPQCRSCRDGGRGSGGRGGDCDDCASVSCFPAGDVTWHGPVLGPVLSTGDFLEVVVCAHDPNDATPPCDSAFVLVDDTPPVMAAVTDAVPDNPLYDSVNLLHPYRTGAVRDSDYQVGSVSSSAPRDSALLES